MTQDTDTATWWLDDAEQEAWRSLLEIGSGLFGLLSRELKGFAGLTLEDYAVLHRLSQADGRRLRVGELSDALLASRTRLSQRIDRLAARGCVERVRCADDRRAIWVELTGAGHDLLVDLAPHHLRDVREHVFDHLTDDEVDDLGRSLSKITRHLRDQRAGPP